MGDVLEVKFPQHVHPDEDEVHFGLDIGGIEHSIPKSALMAFVQGADVPEMIPIAQQIVANWMVMSEKLAANFPEETE